MSESFKIDCEWLTSDYGDASERATLADIVINVGQWNATEVEDTLEKRFRSTVRLSALRLAEWFAANWWRLLWEPRGDNADTYDWLAAHNTRNVGYGYVWPNLSFSSDWQSVHVAARPSSVSKVAPIRYLNHFDHPLPISEFEKGVDDFVNGTIARLHSVGETDTELSALWNEVLEERRDPQMSLYRALEACMGYDPDEAPTGLVYNLLEQSPYDVEQAARDVPASLSSALGSVPAHGNPPLLPQQPAGLQQDNRHYQNADHRQPELWRG